MMILQLLFLFTVTIEGIPVIIGVLEAPLWAKDVGFGLHF
jgi:hypothetical protein